MNPQDYKRLLGEIGNLQAIVKERQNKREPFLSSFADALEDVVKKARVWFNEESKLASREIGILEQLSPSQSFSEEKYNLEGCKKKFEEVAVKFDKTIKSIRSRQVKSLRDFVRKGFFQTSAPEFLGDFEKMFDVCLNLEELIESLEQGAKYILSAQRITEIMIESQKQA